MTKNTKEGKRLTDVTPWRNWGPYLSERAWGTVREDYSADGEAWDYFPHDHARSKAYRWGEDGLAGISDYEQYLCFGLALWNGNDPILKERMFGLTGNQGNHAEDVKEYYYYLDSTPTHSYMKMLYKYPQHAYPYADLIQENQRRGYHDYEYELLDTGIFDEDRYFDVQVEYAKDTADDILIQIQITNHAPDDAVITVLPQIWFRNTWSWGYDAGPLKDVPNKPHMHLNQTTIVADHPTLGTYYLYTNDTEEFIFTENETNHERLHNTKNESPYVKDGFHRHIVNGEDEAIHPDQIGTKASPVYRLTIKSGAVETIHLRLSNTEHNEPFTTFVKTLSTRQEEADEFYDSIHHQGMNEDQKRLQRQAFAGMMWTKQFFYYDVEQWLDGDPVFTPPEERNSGRNSEWRHLNNADIVSMPDKWEYPWYAVWDSAFHCIPLAMIDVDFAKKQLLLFTREWYMHPNGQLPAYEWKFGDVNPPVHAWAAWRVYEMDGKQDKVFLKRIFNKMLINFTWWVNRKDANGRNVFQGGFLGLDNISLFDRSSALPTDGYIDQSDGTSWMGFYSLTMMNIAIELAHDDSSYEDMAIKFFQHFLQIADAMSNEVHSGEVGLWDEEDKFFYDVLRLPDGATVPLKVRSLVGLMPLIAIETIGQPTLDALPDLARSMRWMMSHRPDETENLYSEHIPDYGEAHIFSIPTPERLKQILSYMLDESEFLSEYGIRSLSKFHEDNPYTLNFGSEAFSISYVPAESLSGLFGGNSNWRGPIWFPINYLLIESLRKYHRFYKEDMRVECPTGSGNMMTLDEVADELSRRLLNIFLKDDDGKRAVFGGIERFQNDPNWADHILFYEYFHGDNGAGLGASHQTGWTGLVTALLDQISDK